ncbi:hypothetical protein CYMTET_13630 [Cymbomonas tetramitiformis]|uniref:Uncharacterized protein n=1 Tax=Cymbomonas tetramitiformis TaxID=36881 RepID=A0AAE0LAP5_9CHLO|nr:hypothetical protein CYMTET_13630 [Cymbomonas tetramitiformis]
MLRVAGGERGGGEEREGAARRRSERVNENVHFAADLLGVAYSLIFEGGCAMYGPTTVVVVQSPVTKEAVEIGFVETSDLRTVPSTELQPIAKTGFLMKAKFVTKLYGPKTGLFKMGIKFSVFGGRWWKEGMTLPAGSGGDTKLRLRA